MSRKIVLVVGGPGPEHEVSLGGARSVLRQTDALGWEVLVVGAAKDGRWFVGPGALDRLLADADPRRLPAGTDPPPDPDRLPAQVFYSAPSGEAVLGYDLALPIAHGRWGEDGALQGLLASWGLRVIGCGVTSSAVCFDKHVAKALLSAAGLPVVRGTAVTRREWTSERAETLRRVRDETGGGPWFVKPNRSGSSIGVAPAATGPQLPAAVEHALRWDDVALVEQDVPHRELLVGVVGRHDLLVSPPLECVQPAAVFDYDEKYRNGRLRFEPPAGLGPGRLDEARELAAAAYRALGCEVFARVDLFADQRDGRLLVNEVNTIPGMTAQSAFPRLMAAAGLDYPQLLDELCRLTLEPS